MPVAPAPLDVHQHHPAATSCFLVAPHLECALAVRVNPVQAYVLRVTIVDDDEKCCNY